MRSRKCPGQDLRSWKPGDISEVPCVFCGAVIEFWKDDARARCERCGNAMHNPRFKMGCAEWCAFAKDCIPSLVSSAGDAALCAVLIRELHSTFGEDQRRIRHALRVLGFAERLLESETADPLVVMAAAVLHDIGIPEAERRHGSSAGKYREMEGPPVARRILDKAGAPEALVDRVCRIVADPHGTGNMDSPAFRVFQDADRLAHLFVEAEQRPAGDLRDLIQRSFKTASGRQLANELAAAAK